MKQFKIGDYVVCTDSKSYFFLSGRMYIVKTIDIDDILYDIHISDGIESFWADGNIFITIENHRSRVITEILK